MNSSLNRPQNIKIACMESVKLTPKYRFKKRFPHDGYTFTMNSLIGFFWIVESLMQNYMPLFLITIWTNQI